MFLNEESQIRSNYFHDPTISNEEFGKMIEEAIERDTLASEITEYCEIWSEINA